MKKYLWLFLSLVILPISLFFGGCTESDIDLWYKANREARGSITNDSGIYVQLTNISMVESMDQVNKDGIIGKILELDDSKKGFNELTFSFVPGTTKHILVPTIQALEKSVGFYAKTKLEYTFCAYNSKHEIDFTKTYKLGDLYKDKARTTKVLLTDIFVNQLKFADEWVKAKESSDYFVYSSTKLATAPTSILYSSDAKPIYIFKDDLVKYSDIYKTQEISLKNWADTTQMVENNNRISIYDIDGNEIDLAQINVRLFIEFMGINNAGLASDPNSLLSKWLAE